MKRLPIGMPVIYLLVGIAIGPWGIGLLDLHLVDDAKTIEVLAEIAVLISLLTAGLRLVPSWTMMWRGPIPLATIGMVATISSVALLGHFAAGLPIGAAVLLGAVLAPTDPVLANDVQVNHKDDRDHLRYALTGEAGLNDGAAFPFIMLGLGLMGLHNIGEIGFRWLAVDLIWATTAGLLSGWLIGYLTSRMAVWVKRFTQQPTTCEELLVLATIGLSYGVSMMISAYGFLAVFAAGVAIRVYAERDDHDQHPDEIMMNVAEINDHFERIVEVALVVITGVLLSNSFALFEYWWLPLIIFFIIRPAAVYLALFRSEMTRMQTGLTSFFGIRGIGSLYYLAYATSKGVDSTTSHKLAEIVLATIVVSLIVHSNIVSLVVDRYSKSNEPNNQSSS